MDIVADGELPGPATEASVRAAFDPDDGFWDFVILSRGEFEYIQAGHWWFMGRKTDSTFWHPAFDAATAGTPDHGDHSREPDLYVVEFRDAAGQFGVHRVLPRANLLRLFLAYLAGGDGWRAGLSWEPIAGG